MGASRISNPKSIDESLIQKALDDGTRRIILQFVDEANYSAELLQDVNRMCRSFGSRVNIRFYGHYGSKFDCKWLRHLPDVRSLNLDCLTAVANIGELANLPPLEEFAFGVFEADDPGLLRTRCLTGVRRLTLAGSRKSNVDLAPLADYANLEELFINSHATNIQCLGQHRRIKQLSLASMARKHSLRFVQKMSDLRQLLLILGGRDNASELAHPDLTKLQILRVRGFAEIDMSHFPKLQQLRIEDQIQLRTLDLKKPSSLQSLWIFNCKSLSELVGLRQAGHLENLFVNDAPVNPDAILSELPPSLKHISLFGYGKRKGEELKKRIESMGYGPATFVKSA